MNQSLAHRGTIFVEEGVVLEQRGYPGNQFVLRLEAPKCAAKAEPGSFAHLTCDPAVPMRRPLSIMRVDADQGWVEFLYKIVGDGLRHLATRREGDTLSLMGPIGNPFRLHPDKPRPVLIGGGVGIPPMVFLAESLRYNTQAWQPMVFMGSEIPFPFQPKPSTIMVPGVPDGVIASMPLLDSWGIASRLASGSDFAGCYDGFVTDLAWKWLESLDAKARSEIEIFACGPTPMLRATAKLSRELTLPCQVSLEEYMACAVGGCAGCVVQVRTADGPAMKRVCVDGPVFDAAAVF
ncbi:MAG: dihydroorotate dehydrogenase electron transfer subunit [Gammaproteobacteria bacterium]|nr:dihydroorotate dehydrogenase electron transfer subunit [Gammaproteobacteria bacterium]